MEKLTKQEEEVMQQVWQLGTCTVKDVLQHMPEPRPPYTTLASIMQNLKRKQYVSHRQQGKTYVYEPVIEESDYKRRFLSGFVRDYFQGSFRDMVSFFAREEKLSPDDLKDIIQEIESCEMK